MDIITGRDVSFIQAYPGNTTIITGPCIPLGQAAGHPRLSSYCMSSGSDFDFLTSNLMMMPVPVQGWNMEYMATILADMSGRFTIQTVIDIHSGRQKI